MLDDISHEIFAAAQLTPNEGIEDAVERISDILNREFLKKTNKLSSCDWCGNVADYLQSTCHHCYKKIGR